MATINVQTHLQAASVHLQAGRTQQAVELLRQVITQYPNEPRSRFIMGFIAQRAGQFPEAIRWLNEAIKIDPAPAEPYFLLGLVFQQQRQYPSAIEAYRKCLARKPDDHKALNNLGRSIFETGDISQAIEILEKAIALAPTNAGAFSNLGDALRGRGDLPIAMEYYRKAIAIDPNCAEAYGSMGVVLARMGKAGEGVASLQRSIAINPKSYTTRYNLARVLQDGGLLDEAIQQCQIAIDLRPDSPDAHNLMGNLLGITGQVPQCIAAQRRALELKPDFARVHSNLLLSLNYLPEISPAELFIAHKKWAIQQTQQPSAVIMGPDPFLTADIKGSGPIMTAAVVDRRIRVGYVSPNFNVHSVAFFFEPVLAGHDRAVVEVFCYSDLTTGDAVTQRLRGLSEHWREIAGKSDADVISMIREDGIDILIDLAGHTANNRLPMFARRAAPIQMTWIGYPATTGLTTMDYRLTDPIADPPGISDTLHTEKLLRIDGGCWAYQPPSAPAVGPSPAIANGFITFGSFNNLPKVTPQVIQTWAEILRRVPSSRMVLKSAGLSSKMGRQHVQNHFADAGIAADRIELIGWTPSTESHLKLYDRVDIALDTFPYNGTTTTCESLLMGVPVVTFAGSSHVSRVGAALLTHVGHPEWIAADIAGYISLAGQLAGELTNLTEIRANLRQQLTASPLCDAKRLALQLEEIFKMAVGENDNR